MWINNCYISNIARFFMRPLCHKNNFVYAKFTAKNMTAILSSESKKKSIKTLSPLKHCKTLPLGGQYLEDRIPFSYSANPALPCRDSMTLPR